MAYSTKYAMLFSVKILNLFYLNKGSQEYNSMSETEKAKQIDSYNFNNFIKIVPTTETLKKLNGQNMICKSLNTGLSVMTRVSGSGDIIPFISIQPDLSFTFIIQLVDSQFYNYTNLEPNSPDKLYYFSNRRLSTESDSFPLINMESEDSSIENTFILNTNSSKDELKKLNSAEKDRLFGIIRIFMRADESSLHVVDSMNQILNPCQNFKIQFDNRKTFWRYIFRQDQTVSESSDVEIENANPKTLITKSEQPLTEQGFVSINLGSVELPNPNSNQVIPDATNDKFYSEIYM